MLACNFIPNVLVYVVTRATLIEVAETKYLWCVPRLVATMATLYLHSSRKGATLSCNAHRALAIFRALSPPFPPCRARVPLELTLRLHLRLHAHRTPSSPYFPVCINISSSSAPRRIRDPVTRFLSPVNYSQSRQKLKRVAPFALSARGFLLHTRVYLLLADIM